MKAICSKFSIFKMRLPYGVRLVRYVPVKPSDLDIVDGHVGVPESGYPHGLEQQVFGYREKDNAFTFDLATHAPYHRGIALYKRTLCRSSFLTSKNTQSLRAITFR